LLQKQSFKNHKLETYLFWSRFTDWQQHWQ